MKTKFSFYNCIPSGSSPKESNESVEAYFKEHDLQKEGYVLDLENVDIYKIIDKEIILQEGERVIIDRNFWYLIVVWKLVNIDEGYIEYALKEE